MPRTAIVTGATAGIGRSFASALVDRGMHVVLVARDEARLARVAAELGDSAEVLVADLATAAGVAHVAARAAQDDVELVVNNAGFGLNTPFTDSVLAAEQSLVDVLVTAVMRVTHAALPGMISRGRGGVINVSSVAGWMTSGSYSAAKAWVTTFSESLAVSLRHQPVHVMALCPGYVRTEFQQRADMRVDAIPGWMWLDADRLVEAALRDFERGRAVSVPSARYKLLAGLTRWLPRAAVRRISVVSRSR